MSSRNLAVEHLTADNRRLVETWLAAFESDWDVDRLGQRINALPPDLSLRWPMLLGLVTIDLRRRWEAGQPAKVEEYLLRFPEIGSRDTVPVSLLHTEYQARQKAGNTPSWEEYQQRFPNHLAELRRLVEQSALETAPQKMFATAPLNGHGQNSSEIDLAPPAVGGSQQKIPERLGRYLILRKLGKGGMGSVYLAHDSQLDREVALKVPNFREDEDEENLKRFFREARAAAKIEHPNICPIYDVGEIDGIRYLTMAYIKGRPLSTFLNLGKPIKVNNAVAVARKLALALAAAHQKGIIHRDLKPSNIMINQQNEPILLDFGMAREVFSDQTRLTQYGNLVGTPAYMSPEQVKGELNAMGPGCDIYALGVILYQLLTGHLPYEGETFTVLAKLLTQEPTPPQQHRPSLDEEICRICLKAMAREPRDRYQSMQEMAHALTSYIRKSTGSKDKVPQLRDVTPVRADPAAVPVNAEGTLDLIYFEAKNPAAAALLERAAQAGPHSPPPFAPPSPTPFPAPAAPPAYPPSPMPFPEPVRPPAKQTMLVPRLQAPTTEMPGLNLPPLLSEQAPAASAMETTAPPPSDYTRLIWILGISAVALLLVLVAILVLLLAGKDGGDKTKSTRTASTRPGGDAAPRIEWKVFTPPHSRCTILMPVTPRKANGREQFYAEVEPSISYSLYWGDLSGTFNTGEEVQAALDTERNRLVGSIAGGELLKEETLSLNGHDGRFWEVQATGANTKYLIRCYQVRQRQYVLIISFPLYAADQVEAKKFFESFQLD